jgi:prefoldin beta subunit
MAALSQQQQQGLAAIVDREMSIFKQKQEKLTKLRQKQQTLMEQHSENEMVKTELGLLTPNNEVFKKVGPILMKHEVSEAIDTVEKRLEFIKSDQAKVEAQAKALEEEMQKIAQGVREKQVRMGHLRYRLSRARLSAAN